MGKIKIVLNLVGLILAVSVVQMPAFSQEIGQFELGQVVVTGTKTERVLSEVPVRTEVISSREIKAKGASNLYEALDGIPGIRVEQQCSYCNFSIVRMQGLESGHVQVLIDGQPLFSGVTTVYGLQQIPASLIEKIEVVKGPGSALYGSSAIAGVINVITKQPAKEAGLEIETEFGEEGTNSYGLNASYPFKDGNVLIYGQRNEGDEIYLGEKTGGSHMTDKVWTRSNALGTRLNFFNLTGDDNLTLGARVFNEERKGGEIETFENPFAAGSENIDTERYELQVNYDRPLFIEGDKLGIAFCMFNHHRDATNDTFLGDYEGIYGAEPPLSELEPYKATEQQYGVDINHMFPLGEKNTIMGGFQYTYNELEESGKYVVLDDTAADYSLPYKSESKKHAHEYGLYLQDEIVLLENLQLLLGGRYDIHRSEDSFAGSGDTYGKPVEISYKEESFNPRMSLMYNPQDDFALRLAVGTGFRVPYGFSEDMHLCSGSPRVYKPGSLKPEKSLGATFSADYQGEKWAPWVTIFRTNLEDKIGFADADAEASSLGYDYQWENMGDAYTQGIELGSSFLVSEMLKAGFDMAYTDAQYKDKRNDWLGTAYFDNSRYISRVPEFTGGVNVSFVPGDWEINCIADYTGKMHIDYWQDGEEPTEIVHTEPFWVLNLKVSKHNFLKEGLTVFTGVRNLLDEVQEIKHPDDAAFMYAPYYGRIIYAGLNFSF